MVKIAVLGYGTIGSGVVEVLETNTSSIAERAGEEIGVKYILDLKDFPNDPHGHLIVHDMDTILQDEEVRVVVETMGGTGAAYTFVKAALEAGKHVATSNKALVAKYGAELMDLAKQKNINFLFEASVGGGIPIIRTVNSSLSADEIEEITGILNGTTNYIMTKMDQEGSQFEDVLKEAQELGYAEADPTDDVEGYDACRKIAILTSLVCGHHVDFEEIHTEGITNITAEDMQYAAAMGRTIKLLATSHKVGNDYYAMVAPFMLSKEHPLYNVHGVFNAVFIHGNVLDDAMFYGRGAGKLPTASAVAADVVDIVKHLHRNIWISWSSRKMDLLDYKKATNRFFVRVKGTPSEKQAELEQLFGKGDIVQVPSLDGEFGFVTEAVAEETFETAYEKVSDAITRIRLA